MDNDKPPFENWKFMVGIVLIAEGLTVAGFAISMPIIPFLLMDLFALEGSELRLWNGLLAALPALSMALFSPVWGALADSMGKRLMLARAMFVGGSLVVFMTFVQSPGQLLALRTAQGGMTGSIAAATVLVLALTPKKHLTTSMVLLQISIHMGNSLGPLIGGWTYDLLGGRPNFLISVAMLFIAGTLIMLFVKEPPIIAHPEGKRKHSFVPDFSAIKSNQILVLLLSVTFFMQMGFTLVNSIMPLFIKQLAPDSLYLGTISGLMMGISALVLALGAITFTYLSRRVSLPLLIIIGIAGAGLFYLPQSMSTTWQMLLIFRVIGSFFIGGITPLLTVLISQNTPKASQGSIFGINSSLSSTGNALGPAIGILIANASWGGYRHVFVAGFFLLISLVIIMVRERANWFKTAES